MEYENKLPIWITDWTFEMPKSKVKYVAKDVFAKGWTEEEIINNAMLVSKALAKIKLRKNKYKLKVKSIDLKSQHGYGPKYENEKLFQ
jgi:hypothetical protein